MTVILDIIGALFVRSAIIITMLTVSATMNEALYFKTAHRNIQTDLSGAVDVIELDFLKIGYNVGVTPFFLAVDTSSITFLSDVDNNAVFDTVRYYIGNTSELSQTPNPRDRVLYRRINASQPYTVSAGVTRFYLKYYDSAGKQTSDLFLIVSVNVELEVEHGSLTYNDVYPNARWQRRIFPVNM